MVSQKMKNLFSGPTGSLLFIRMYAVTVLLAAGLGAVVLYGREERFSGPAFAGPRDFVEWVPVLAPYQVWAGAFLIYGLLLVAALGRAYAVHVLRVGMILYFFFSLSFALSVLSNPVAAATGVVAYLCFFLIHLFLSDHLSATGWK